MGFLVGLIWVLGGCVDSRDVTWCLGFGVGFVGFGVVGFLVHCLLRCRFPGWFNFLRCGVVRTCWVLLFVSIRCLLGWAFW